MSDEQNKKNLIREYIRALNQGNAVLFAGAGLSIPSGGISWPDLLEEEARAIGIDAYREHDLTSVAQYIYNETGSRQTITHLLKKHINKHGNLNENHQIFASLPIHKIWTTNYDHYIENSLIEQGKDIDVKRSVEDITSEVEDADTVIYKMHGDIGNLHNTVILKDDYEIYDRKNELFTHTLQNDLLNNTFLFFGFSFDDPNLQNILSKVRILTGETKRRHYCILKEVALNDKEFEELEGKDKEEAYEYRKRLQKLKVNDLKRYGIYAVLVKDYEKMTDILYSIKHHYLANRIFISGAYEHIDNFLGYDGLETADKFCERLGSRLHKNRYKVKSGFGLSVGRNIIQGFLNEDVKEGNKKLSNNLVIYPFPENLDTEQKYAYRKNIMDDTGVSILLFGNKIDPNNKENFIISDGVIDEYKVALEKGHFIIPIGLTGYAAKKMWKQVTRFTKNPEMNQLIERLNDDSFHDEEMSKKDRIEYVLDILFEILDLYRENIDDLHYDLK